MGETRESLQNQSLSTRCFWLLVLLVVGQACLWWWRWGSFSRLIACASLSMHTYCWNTLAVAYLGENLDINAFSISTRKAKDA